MMIGEGEPVNGRELRAAGRSLQKKAGLYRARLKVLAT
jgi:hypothetical protein